MKILKTNEALQCVVVGVSSLVLIVSLVATIFGKDAAIHEAGLIFSGIAAWVFGAHIFTRPPKE